MLPLFKAVSLKDRGSLYFAKLLQALGTPRPLFHLKHAPTITGDCQAHLSILAKRNRFAGVSFRRKHSVQLGAAS